MKLQQLDTPAQSPAPLLYSAQDPFGRHRLRRRTKNTPLGSGVHALFHLGRERVSKITIDELRIALLSHQHTNQPLRKEKE